MSVLPVHVDGGPSRSGCASLFEDIYRRSLPRIRHYVSRHGLLSARDDLVQEVFAHLWRCLLGGWRGEQVEAYLVGIARNLCAKHRFQSRRQRQVHDDLTQLHHRLRGPEQYDPAKPLSGDEMAATLSRVFADLPAAQQAAMRLVYGEGLSVNEAARRCGCSANTLSSRLRRARVRLQRGGLLQLLLNE